MPRPVRKTARSKRRTRVTTISFSGADLSALARYLASGVVLLQTTHPVLGRVKAAMTRLGLPAPKGL